MNLPNDNALSWLHPGSRWWKFDFHTHTPASTDTPWQKNRLDLTEQQWLLRYMAAGIDCVAVTDHNSGAWIDRLKSTYMAMKAQADNGRPVEGFRELTIFPGVEISVSGGFHLLALFDPDAAMRKVTDLLATVGYQGNEGASDGVTRQGPEIVVQNVLEAGGIPIPAHADQDKGLLRVKPATRECALDANTVRQIVEIEGLLGVEWLDAGLQPPQCVERSCKHLARVLGSDCHSFQGSAVPGSRYTWVKMAKPTLEGLRLALLDGNGISIRRSDEGAFEPFKTPAHFIAAIEIESAQLMGNGQAIRLELTPYYNALIGGRGTGKSTVVHTIRLAFHRHEELKRLGEESDTYLQFNRFRKPAKGRDGEGALRENTEIRIELMREGVPHRLRWRVDGKGSIVEERDALGGCQLSASQAVHAERFPIRLFSQGQIAAMAGNGRQVLLDVIDETASIAPLKQAFEEDRRTYFTQRARLRELDGKLAKRPEVERKLAELSRKLEAFAQSHHAEVLKAHNQFQRQKYEIEQTQVHLHTMPGQIEALAQKIVLDDWSEGMFDPGADADVFAWRQGLEATLGEAREALNQVVAMLRKHTGELEADIRLTGWRNRVEQAQVAYETLQSALAAQGVKDPQEFGRLVQERQQIESELRQFDQIKQERDRLQTDSDAQSRQVINARQAITQARARFVEDTLHANPFVRMEVIGFGFDAPLIERSLRALLDTPDHFEGDILRQSIDGEPESGLAYELAKANDKTGLLASVKQRLVNLDPVLGGRFRKFLQKKLEKPEFADHVLLWFPEDDLQIKYSRGGDGKDWAAIHQGSQGQRSAALLAFLLAFGDEPLVLDQPEDDLDNHLIYDLIVRQIRENKLRRQLVIITHNPNVVVNGDAELVHVFDFQGGQCRIRERGALQEKNVREEVCRVMEGGREAFARRWARLGKEV